MRDLLCHMRIVTLNRIPPEIYTRRYNAPVVVEGLAAHGGNTFLHGVNSRYPIVHHINIMLSQSIVTKLDGIHGALTAHHLVTHIPSKMVFIGFNQGYFNTRVCPPQIFGSCGTSGPPTNNNNLLSGTQCDKRHSYHTSSGDNTSGFYKITTIYFHSYSPLISG